MPMPADLIITSIADAYIGDYNAGVPLTQLMATRTQGGEFHYGVKRQWEDCDGDYRQVERAIVTLDLTFYWDQSIYRLAMNTSLNETNLDDPTTGAKYTVLAVMPNENSESSILIPLCTALCNVEEPHKKTEGSIVPVHFEWQDRNKNKQLHRRGDYATLAAILGSSSPF